MPLTNLITVGRSQECDVTIESVALSYRHAIILRSDDGSNLLIDCGSTNGTRLRSKDGLVKIKQSVVLDSQRVLFGDYECEIASLIAENQPGKGGVNDQNYTMMRDPQTGEVRYDKK